MVAHSLLDTKRPPDFSFGEDVLDQKQGGWEWNSRQYVLMHGCVSVHGCFSMCRLQFVVFPEGFVIMNPARFKCGSTEKVLL